MAEFYAALLDLVEEHVRSEVEENLTWAEPRQEDLDAAFRALLLEGLRAALGDAVEPRSGSEALR